MGAGDTSKHHFPRYAAVILEHWKKIGPVDSICESIAYPFINPQMSQFDSLNNRGVNLTQFCKIHGYWY